MAAKKQIREEWVPISSLTRWDRNPNTHPEHQIEHLASMMRRFGWTIPVLVVRIESEGVEEVRAGHGRLLAAELNLREFPDFIPANAPPGSAPGVVKVTRASVATRGEADAYGLADNRISSVAEVDEDALVRLLAELQAEEVEISELGWQEEELDDLLAEMAREAEEESAGERTDVSAHDRSPPSEFPSYDEEIHTDYRCPKCDYTWSGRKS